MKKSLGAKTLAAPAPVWIVATYDSAGKPNAMTASWAGICCSNPPCVYVSLRKATYTYGNIAERKAYTLNIPQANQAREADYLGIASGRDHDKLKQVKFNTEKSQLVDAPYIVECPLILECRLLKSVELGLHTQFIGEIVDVKADEEILGKGALPDLEKLDPFLLCPESREYFHIGKSLGPAFSIGRQLDG